MAKRKTAKKTTRKTTKTVKRRKTTARKTTRKTPAKRRAAKVMESPESIAVNRHALWSTYRELQSRVDRALDKLRMHCTTRAMPQVLLEDKKELLFLLGECNYMARTCSELEASQEKRDRSADVNPAHLL